MFCVKKLGLSNIYFNDMEKLCLFCKIFYFTFITINNEENNMHEVDLISVINTLSRNGFNKLQNV